MLSDKGTVPVGGRKLLCLVEDELQRCDVRLQQHVWDDRLCDEVRSCRYPIVHIPAGITVWPPVEPTLNHVREIIGWDIIANVVPLVNRGPQVARLRIDSNSHGIPQPACVDLHILPRRVRNQNCGASGIGLNGDIAARPHGNKQPSAIETKGQRACPMLVIALSRKLKDVLCLAQSLRRFGVIAKA